MAEGQRCCWGQTKVAVEGGTRMVTRVARSPLRVRGEMRVGEGVPGWMMVVAAAQVVMRMRREVAGRSQVVQVVTGRSRSQRRGQRWSQAQ